MEPPAVKYIAQLVGVRELALWGAAELSWWRDHLAGEELEPVEVDGQAQVFVTGLDAKWMGIPFRDISVAVAARRLSGSAETGVFLARAFNASRFIAGVERWWFHLPYLFRADLHVKVGDPAAMRLGGQPGADLLAELGPRELSGESAAAQEMGYTGALFLPTGRDRNRRRWFMVQIRGLTSTFDFDAARDRFEVGSGCGDPILAGLRASQFRGVQWYVRRSASHARSKTFQARR